MRRFPALVLIIILAFPLLFSAFTLVAIGTFVFNRGFYQRLLSDERLYTIPDAVSGATWHLTIPELQPLTARAATDAVRDVITPAWLRSEATRIVDQTFDFIDGKGPLELSLDLAPVKRALAGGQGERFALDFARGLPVCSSPTPARPGTLPVCRPANQSVSETARQIVQSLPGVIARIPDRVPLGDEVPLPWTGFSVPRLYFAFAAVLLLAGVGTWLGAAFTGSSEPRGRLLWLGGSLLAPAFLVLLAGFFALAPAPVSLVNYGLSEASLQGVRLPADFTVAVVAAAKTALMRVATGFLATGGIATGIALGLLAWGWSTPVGGRRSSSGTSTTASPPGASPEDASPSTPA